MDCFPLLTTETPFGISLQAVVPVTYSNPGTGRIFNANVEFDSGATISLAPAALAGALGLVLTSGVPLGLSGVSGAGFTTYVHTVDLQIGQKLYRDVFVAIATDDTVPFLLGRTNFWDMASIQIDDVNNQICITSITGVPAPTHQVTPNIGVVLLGAGAAALVFLFLVKR